MGSKRDKNHATAIRMLHQLGFVTFSDPTLPIQQRNHFDTGRPDIVALRGTIGVCIECKNFQERFPFAAWTEQQRRWAQERHTENGVEYWIYLTLGTRVNAKYKPKKTWLMPFSVMLSVEKKVIEYGQQSIPYSVGKGMLKTIQNDHIDAVTLLAEWEIFWDKERKCFMPQESHPFYTMFVR